MRAEGRFIFQLHATVGTPRGVGYPGDDRARTSPDGSRGPLMKISLINPTPADHYSPCIRTLSASLKQQGHEVRLIFLPADTYAHLHQREGYIMQMAQPMVDEVVDLVADSDPLSFQIMAALREWGARWFWLPVANRRWHRRLR